MEREMERCGNAKISVELERIPNKNAFYENAITRSIENAITRSIDNLWFA